MSRHPTDSTIPGLDKKSGARALAATLRATRWGVLLVVQSMDAGGKDSTIRLDRPDKVWKFDPADLAERALWDDYATAYEEALAATAVDHAPWYVIPADHKWVARLLVATLLRTTLEALDPRYPPPGKGLDEPRRKLETE